MASQPHVSVQSRTNPYAWVFALLGIVSIAFGVMCIVWPGPTVSALVYLVGVFAAISGALSLVGVYYAIKYQAPWWPALAIAIVDIAAAVIVFTYPDLTATALVSVVAFWAILSGSFKVFASLVSARFLWLIDGLLSLLIGFILLANPQQGALALVLVIGFFAIIRGILYLIDSYRAPRIVELQVF